MGGGGEGILVFVCFCTTILFSLILLCFLLISHLLTPLPFFGIRHVLKNKTKQNKQKKQRRAWGAQNKTCMGKCSKELHNSCYCSCRHYHKLFLSFFCQRNKPISLDYLLFFFVFSRKYLRMSSGTVLNSAFALELAVLAIDLTHTHKKTKKKTTTKKKKTKKKTRHLQEY